MNAPFRGTDFLSVDVFLGRLKVMPVGIPFVYATGDLAYTAPRDPNLARLRNMVWQLYENREIALTQRVRPDLTFCGGRAFEYLATKRTEAKREKR